MAGALAGLPLTPVAASVALIVPRKVAGVGVGEEVAPTGPDKFELQGHRLQVHIPEAVRLLWQVTTKDPQTRKHKGHSVKAVTSGPGSHKNRSPQQACSAVRLRTVPPPDCPGSGKGFESPSSPICPRARLLERFQVKSGPFRKRPNLCSEHLVCVRGLQCLPHQRTEPGFSLGSILCLRP